MSARLASERTTLLTRDEVLRAALRIIDAEGLEALSMRRLASDLGVKAMALYHHFPSKGSILDGVTNAIVREMRLPEPLPDSWVDQLVEMVVAFRSALTSHPNAVPLMVTRPLGPPEEAMVTPATVLTAQGFDLERLTEMYQALMALTFGHALVSTVSRSAAEEPERGEGAAEPLLLDDTGFRRAARFLVEGFAADANH